MNPTTEQIEQTLRRRVGESWDYYDETLKGICIAAFAVGYDDGYDIGFQCGSAAERGIERLMKEPPAPSYPSSDLAHSNGGGSDTAPDAGDSTQYEQHPLWGKVPVL